MKRKLLSITLCIFLSGTLAACSDVAFETVSLSAEDLEAASVPEQETVSEAESPAGTYADDPSETSPVETSEPALQPASDIHAESTAASAPEESGSDTIAWAGTWEMKDYQFASVSALSTEDADACLDYTVTYSADSFGLNGSTILEQDNLYSDFSTYTYDSFTEDFSANLGEWWNGIEEVTLISIETPDNSFGSHFLLVDDDTLWISYEGVFFLARRAQ